MVVTDSILLVFYGYHEVLGSLTCADVEHLCLWYIDPKLETYNAQYLHNGAMVVGTGLNFDRLSLEQVYTTPIEPQADYA